MKMSEILWVLLSEWVIQIAYNHSSLASYSCFSECPFSLITLCLVVFAYSLNGKEKEVFLVKMAIKLKAWQTIRRTEMGIFRLHSSRQSQQLLKLYEYDIPHLSTAVSEHIVAFFVNCVFYTSRPITRCSKFSEIKNLPKGKVSHI